MKSEKDNKKISDVLSYLKNNYGVNNVDDLNSAIKNMFKKAI